MIFPLGFCNFNCNLILGFYPFVKITTLPRRLFCILDLESSQLSTNCIKVDRVLLVNKYTVKITTRPPGFENSRETSLEHVSRVKNVENSILELLDVPLVKLTILVLETVDNRLTGLVEQFRITSLTDVLDVHSALGIRRKHKLCNFLRIEELDLHCMVSNDSRQSGLKIFRELLRTRILLAVVGVENHHSITDSFCLRILSSKHLLIVEDILLVLRHRGESSRIHVERLFFSIRVAKERDLVPDLTEITRYDLNDRLASQFVERSSIITLSEQVVRRCGCSRDVRNVISKERLPP